MPLIPGVVETFDYLKTLHKLKNDDYSGDNGPFFNFDFADYVAAIFKGTRDKVYAVVIGIKIARLSVVMYKQANNESVEDTFNDLINYACIWKADYMQRTKVPIRHITDMATIRETRSE